MIELYTWPTPNGRKISILLEELKVRYKVIPINIDNNEQFFEKFSRISPSNKIPIINDKETSTTIFEFYRIALVKQSNYFKPTEKIDYELSSS